MTKKICCWEYMECGREPGGINADEFGICPSSIASRCDGINGGINAGRYCWPVSGTFCNGDLQGTFAAKIKDCLKCPFFMSVVHEEGNTSVFMKQDSSTR